MLTILLAAAVSGAAPPAQAVTAPAPAAQAARSPFASPSLDTETLGKATAREDISQVASADQSASVSGNSVSGQSTTGTVTIDGNAFQNQSGLTIVNANTGNNVAINAAMNVNIVFAPLPPQ